MKADWGIKFVRGQVVLLNKHGKGPTRVRIIGVAVFAHSPNDPMYDVREVDSGVQYPALQSSLKAIPRQA